MKTADEVRKELDMEITPTCQPWCGKHDDRLPTGMNYGCSPACLRLNRAVKPDRRVLGMRK
jgi:hypothetical protein